MPVGQNSPIEHEWQISNHKLFKKLDLKSYTKDDVEIWATYQGMLHLNNIVDDYSANVKHVKLEDIVSNQKIFQSLVNYLTHERISYSKELLSTIYSWVWTPFRGEGTLIVKPEEELHQWPEWKVRALQELHTTEARKCYEQLGYKY